jgi:uncharacterized protein YbjT (DUF2867 family)
MQPDFDNDLLLVTAASGKQSTQLISHLLRKWKHLRLQVATAASKARLEQQYPGTGVVQADLSAQQACLDLLQGVAFVFLITPGIHGHETACGYHVIDAALAQGATFKHLVYSSVLHPILRKLLNHDAKRYVEEYLIESGLSYTILQPTVMMENLPLQALVKDENPVFPAMWDPATKFSFVSTRDIGEAAFNVLSNPSKHGYATYQLVGTRELMDFNGALSIVSEEIGKPVRIENHSLEDGVEMFSERLTHGEPEKADFALKQGCGRMLMYYEQKGLLGNPNVLEMLLGRKPLGYREWVRLNVQELKGK